VSVDKTVITELMYQSEAITSELPSQDSVKCAHAPCAKKQVVVAPASEVMVCAATDEQRCKDCG